MDIEHFPPEVEPVISEPAPSRWWQWRARLQSFRAPALRVALFALGVAAAFVAVLFYQLLFPPARQLTARDVNASVPQALASVTPLPAYSERVYQVIQPSLVL